MAHKWAEMLHHPYILRDPQIKEDKIRIGPQVGGNATPPLHSWGSPNKGEQKHNWPTSGRYCHITPAFSGIPKQRGTKSELAHEWAEMLHHPCILGDSQTTGDKIKIGQQVGGNATSPLHSRASLNKGGQNQNWPMNSGNATSTLDSRGFPNRGRQNQTWPTSGRKCYITTAFSGIPK